LELHTRYDKNKEIKDSQRKNSTASITSAFGKIKKNNRNKNNVSPCKNNPQNTASMVLVK